MAEKKKKKQVPEGVSKQAFEMLSVEDQNYLSRDVEISVSSMKMQTNEQLSKIVDRITKLEEKIFDLIEELNEGVIEEDTFSVNVIEYIKKINNLNVQIEILKSKSQVLGKMSNSTEE